MPFEDAALGVSVHRGVYEAALALYPRFEPIVLEHLAASPFARVSFTGHSLGGSIATVLAIIMVHRGLLRPSQLAPVYTFGAAACFCEVEHIERIERGVPQVRPPPSLTVTTRSVRRGYRLLDSCGSVLLGLRVGASGARFLYAARVRFSAPGLTEEVLCRPGAARARMRGCCACSAFRATRCATSF